MDRHAVAADQPVAFNVMMKGVEEPFFPGQTLQEMQVCVSGLHAVFAWQMLIGDGLFVVHHAVLVKHGLQDFRYGHLLENTPIGTQARSSQQRFDGGAVAGAAKACGALFKARDDTALLR